MAGMNIKVLFRIAFIASTYTLEGRYKNCKGKETLKAGFRMFFLIN